MFTFLYCCLCYVFILLCYIDSDGDEEEGEENIPIESKMKLKAKATIVGYVSALKDYYTCHNVAWPEDLKNALKEICAGHAKDVARMKKSGHMKLGEGKERISIRGYMLVCTKFITMKPEPQGPRLGCRGDWRAGSFGWAYNTLMWNLMSRSISVAEIMLVHLSWSEDCLKVAWPMHKGDQSGKDAFDRSVFANPTSPGKSCYGTYSSFYANYVFYYATYL